MLNIFFLTLTNKNYGNPILSPVLGGRGRSPEGVYNLNEVATPCRDARLVRPQSSTPSNPQATYAEKE